MTSPALSKNEILNCKLFKYINILIIEVNPFPNLNLVEEMPVKQIQIDGSYFVLGLTETEIWPDKSEDLFKAPSPGMEIIDCPPVQDR